MRQWLLATQDRHLTFVVTQHNVNSVFELSQNDHDSTVLYSTWSLAYLCIYVTKYIAEVTEVIEV